MVVVMGSALDMLKQLSVQEKKFVQQNSRHHKMLTLTGGHRYKTFDVVTFNKIKRCMDQ